MRKWLWILAMGLAFVTAAHAEPLKNKIGLTYSLLLKNGGTLTPSSLLDGLDSGDSFRLQIRPGQEVFQGGHFNPVLGQKIRFDLANVVPQQFHTKSRGAA